MFIYLSKKIAIPNNVRLHTVSWNSEQGWIACGGEGGLLKVLKLSSPTDQGGGSNLLSMNQTLEGHNGTVMVVTWNENYRKLTTSDENGLIIVWTLHKGMWFEEMINNRNKSVVRDMKWTSDGQKICIVYQDGAVIVGSVDGNRLWGKDLPISLAFVQWSPDGRNLLFCTLPQEYPKSGGEVHVYDANGNFITKLPLFCLEDGGPGVNIVGIDWYDGSEGYTDPNAPSLALCFENGRMQLMRHESDDNPVLIDTQMKATRIQWNSCGSVLGVSGTQEAVQNGDRKEVNMVQFYTPFGQHLRTLKVPGSGVKGFSWEGDGLRIALAVDSFIYFANIRPDYKWGYFGNTVVYAFTKADRLEHCLIFWDTNNNEKYTKYVKKLLMIRAHGDHCVLATKADDNSGQYILIVCNAIGSPVDSKYIDIEPVYMTMTKYHIIVCSEDTVYVWEFRTRVSKLTSIEQQELTQAMRTKGRERVFHIDETPSGSTATSFDTFRKVDRVTQNSIACVAAHENSFIVGRESGQIIRYALPHVTLESKHVLRTRPQMLAINCDCTRLSVIDISGILTFFDLSGNAGGEHLQFERKDVWDMTWSSDNPELFAMMEKTRMYVFRNLSPEEPVTSNGYICAFSDLTIKVILLDDVMKNAENPEKDNILSYETRSLRDAKEILNRVGIEDGYKFIEDNPHPRLWRILAEHALEKLEFGVAEKAFMKCSDYQGIQFVKRLRIIDSKQLQRAEAASYFKRFDEAERIYREIDRKDLAISLKMRLGDWFGVANLVQAGVGDDTLLTTAWNKIGEYFADRQKWSQAVGYFQNAKNYEKLVQCYYILEEYTKLEQLINILPEGSPHLLSVGDKFTSVGMSECAVNAYIRAGDVKAAIDSCVLLNQWDTAVRLAEQNNFQQIENLLSKYASHLMEKNRQFEAIDLYRKANHHSEASNLLRKLAKDCGGIGFHPLRAKKLSVLAALEAEKYRKKTLETQVTEGYKATAEKLTTLLQDTEKPGSIQLEGSWRPAEAYHFYMLAHRQLYDGRLSDAMRTAMRLADYEDILEPLDIYSIIAVTTFCSKYYGLCSQAFIKLEAIPNVPAKKREAIQDLAVSIFVQCKPENPKGKKVKCNKCRGDMDDWMIACPSCSHKHHACVATGRTLFQPTFVCRACKHHIDDHTMEGVKHCPLCHSLLR
eukprot:GFYU01004159.1.p1 GENE.GFYU01004159.1~~GFYU01004159.1.p1  ORF type:complete len:1174 (+),score=402.74 GFYU01004159.1:102-3623(+)